MWGLVNHKGRVVRSHKRKYDLLKYGVETKEPISKKTIKNFQDGSIVTVIYRKTYQKWFTDERTGRYYKDTVNEVNEMQYTLREFDIVFKN